MLKINVKKNATINYRFRFSYAFALTSIIIKMQNLHPLQQQQNYNNEHNNCILRDHLYRLIMSPSSSNKVSSIDTKNDNSDRKNDNSDDKNDSEQYITTIATKTGHESSNTITKLYISKR